MPIVIRVYENESNKYIGDVLLADWYTVNAIENEYYLYDFIPRNFDESVYDGKFHKRNVTKEKEISKEILNSNKEKAIHYKNVWVNKYSLLMVTEDEGSIWKIVKA